MLGETIAVQKRGEMSQETLILPISDDTAQGRCAQTHCRLPKTGKSDGHPAERGRQGHGKRSVQVYA